MSFYSTSYSKKTLFLRKPWKTVLEANLTVFLGKGCVLCKKLTYLFLWQIMYWIFYYLADFSKKAVIFWENGKKPFLEAKSLLKGRRHLATKMNITSFMGNEVLKIFSFYNFFEKSNIFGENGGKKSGGAVSVHTAICSNVKRLWVVASVKKICLKYLSFQITISSNYSKNLGKISSKIFSLKIDC